MLILALDTTTRAGSVAILDGARTVVEFAGDEGVTHGQRLPTALMEACRRAGVEIGEIEMLAVAAGPGSFTGLRIGIAAMQGLATARGLKIVPVSTLEAIAAAAAGASPRVAAWIDAHRGEVFAQIFERTAVEVRPLVAAVSARPEEVLGLHASALDAAEFHGDGALRYQEAIRAALGDDVGVASEVPLLAGAVGRLAERAPGRAVLPHAVVPIYVRRPDAEIARDRRAHGA